MALLRILSDLNNPVVYMVSVLLLISNSSNPFFKAVRLPFRQGLENTQNASLQRRKIPRPNECPGYDIKQSDGEFPVMLELWGVQSTPSLPSLPGSLWPGVVAPDSVLSNRHIELNCTHAKFLEIRLFWHLNCVLMLKWIFRNRTVFWHWNCTYTKLNCLK